MPIETVVHSGADDAFLAWASDFIPGCRGFAIRRKILRVPGSVPSPNTESIIPDANGFVEEIVASWVGFANGPDVEDGTRKPTTEWPIQKYLWADYMVSAGDKVSYRVVPVTGPANTLTENPQLASAWSPTLVIGPEAGDGYSCFFNRGIVGSQWLGRLLPADADPKKSITVKNQKLKKIVSTPGDRTRNFLGGPLRSRLVAILDEAVAAKRHVFAVLYELDDPELQPLLKKLKKRAHVVLGNGSVKKRGKTKTGKHAPTFPVFVKCMTAFLPRGPWHTINSWLFAMRTRNLKWCGPAAQTGRRQVFAPNQTMRF